MHPVSPPALRAFCLRAIFRDARRAFDRASFANTLHLPSISTHSKLRKRRNSDSRKGCAGSPGGRRSGGTRISPHGRGLSGCRIGSAGSTLVPSRSLDPSSPYVPAQICISNMYLRARPIKRFSVFRSLFSVPVRVCPAVFVPNDMKQTWGTDNGIRTTENGASPRAPFARRALQGGSKGTRRASRPGSRT